MTAILAWAASGFVTGAAVATAVTYWRLTIRYDLDGWNRRRLEAINVRAVAEVAEERVHEVRAETRAWVADLLDKVADRDRVIARLRRPRRPRNYPMPYGVNR